MVVKKPSTKKSSLRRNNENTKGKGKYEVVAKKVTVVKKNEKNPGEKELTDKEIGEGRKGKSGKDISLLSSSNIGTGWQNINAIVH